MRRPALRAFQCVVLFGATLMLGGLSARAQTATPPAAQATPDPAKPETKPDNPGLLNELGKLFVKPSDLFPSFKLSPDAATPTLSPAQPSDSPDVAPAPPAIAAPASPTPPAAAAAPATSPSGRIPQMVSGRASCPFSSNGAPDCKSGADSLCKSKGFASGSSLGMDSARTCSTQALLAGARHIRDICKTETFVTSAMCQ